MLDASLPATLMMGAPGTFSSVPLTWTQQSVVIGATATSPAASIDLGGPHAGTMLIDTLVSLVSSFFADRVNATEMVQ